MVLGRLPPEVLNYFIAYLQFWGILPHDNFHKNKSMFVKNLVLMFSITFVLIWSYYFTVMTLYPHITAMHIAVDVVRFILNISVPLVFLVHLIGGNPKWLEILDYLDQVKAVAHLYARAIWQLILYSTFITGSLILYVSHSFRGDTSTSFLMKLSVVSLYYESLCAVSICLVNKAVTSRMLTIKIILHKLHRYKLSSLSCIKDMKRHYLGAVEIIVVLDSYFGGKILVNFGNSTVRLLWIFISSIHYLNPEKFINSLNVNWEQFSRALIMAVYGMDSFNNPKTPNVLTSSLRSKMSGTVLFLSTFMGFLQFWGIIPYKDPHKRNLKGLLLMLMIVFLLCVLVIIFVLGGVYYIDRDVGPKVDTIRLSVNILKFGFNVLIPVSTLPYVISRDKKMNIIMNISNEVKSNRLIVAYKKTFLFCTFYMIVVHIALAFFLIENYHLPLVPQDHSIVAFLMKAPALGLYYENLVTMAFVLLNLPITDKLELIKLRLKKLNECNQRFSLSSIKTLKREYLLSKKMNSIMNEYFGFKILVHFANGAARLLWILVFFIELWNDEKLTGSKRFSSQFVLKSFWFGMIGMIPAFIITASCGKVTKSTDYLISSCYRLQYKFPHGSYEQRELHSLWKYISENKLVYTGMGFYQIQPPVLLGIVASSTTYFIALIQFNG